MTAAITPTPEEFRTYDRRVVRMVEAQHRISTNRLAASPAAQLLLEQLADEVKPQVPPAARQLHFLLASPFRYGHRLESRFRAAGERPGIFYASEQEATAVAETAYWRLRFFARSPGVQLPATTSEHSLFSVRLRSGAMLDLTKAPFVARRADWMDPQDYRACQAFAGQARGIATSLIRYASVRDAAHRANLALFDPAAFADRAPRLEQTWHLRFEHGELSALPAFPATGGYRFTAAGFGL